MLTTLQWSIYDLIPGYLSLTSISFISPCLLPLQPSWFLCCSLNMVNTLVLGPLHLFPKHFFCLGSSFSTFMNGSHFLWISTQTSLQLGVPCSFFKTSVLLPIPICPTPFPISLFSMTWITMCYFINFTCSLASSHNCKQEHSPVLFPSM